MSGDNFLERWANQPDREGLDEFFAESILKLDCNDCSLTYQKVLDVVRSAMKDKP